MKLAFWIFVLIFTSAIVLKFYGRSGLKFVLGLTGTLLASDIIQHFWGRTAASIFVGIFAICGICVYIGRRTKDEHSDN
jgi:hypothetical protein